MNRTTARRTIAAIALGLGIATAPFLGSSAASAATPALKVLSVSVYDLNHVGNPDSFPMTNCTPGPFACVSNPNPNRYVNPMKIQRSDRVKVCAVVQNVGSARTTARNLTVKGPSYSALASVPAGVFPGLVTTACTPVYSLDFSAGRSPFTCQAIRLSVIGDFGAVGSPAFYQEPCEGPVPVIN